MTATSRAEFDQLIRNRLATDSSFADTLTANPRAAISELVGSELPAGLVIDVHRDSLSHLHIVIPVMNATGELAEDDLDLVAGGVTSANAPFAWLFGDAGRFQPPPTPNEPSGP